MSEVFDVQVISLAYIRADQQGVLIAELADIICEVFS